MKTLTDLLEITANGENSVVEFKRDDLQNHALAKEIVAFSNLGGGMVLLGIENSGSVAGLTRANLEEWVMTACRDKIRPGIVPFFEVIKDVEHGKDVAVVRVPPGAAFQSLWHNNRNTYYIRVGSQSREPTPDELSFLLQQRGMFRGELRPTSGATLNDLDRRRLKDYFERVRQQEVPHDSDAAGWQTWLVNTQIMVEEGVTLAGMLLFGKTPKRFLPQAGIDAVAFAGTEKGYATQEHTTLTGPMTPLMDQHGNVIEAGLVEQALEFVKRNTQVSVVLEDGARRVEKHAYPDEVIREAVVNALIHRDYVLGNADIELRIYQDRLELTSPGRLPNRITLERMRAGTRTARNQFLKDVMRDYGYLGRMGMGIPRRIIRGMKEHNQTEPDLLESDERFMVRLFAGSPGWG